MRRWPWVVATLGSAAIGITIGVAWWVGGPSQAGVWATILALLLVGVALFGWAQTASQARPTSTPEEVDAATKKSPAYRAPGA